MRRSFPVLLVVLVALACVSPAAAKRSVPSGWMGMVIDTNSTGTLFDSRVNFQGELALMARSGVETIRFPVYWVAMQPTAISPIDFSYTDRVVGAAARQGIRVQPTVVQAPFFARTTSSLWSPPRDPALYGQFVGALARRYGARGSFWRGRRGPRLPVTSWQIWNEPNDLFFWSEDAGRTPASLQKYVALLKASRSALRSADPRARIVMGGLVKRAWEALAKIYRFGGRRYFDAVSVHPFTATAANEVKIIELTRRVMARNRDARKPIELTESSWTSAKGKTNIRYGYEETERGQARRLRAHFLELAKQRKRLHIERVLWYTWMTFDSSKVQPFDYAGVRTLRPGSRGPRAKPAYRAFVDVARRLEGCGKTSTARCRR